MECIEINVSKEIAKKWREVAPDQREKIERRIGIELDKELNSGANDDFQRFLDEIRRKVKERGLTEEILQDILNQDE